MQTGTVKFFNETKGYGFIKSEGKEIFVHVSGLADKKEKLFDNDEVEFTITEGKRGPQAINVKKL